jgi:hypothetical protein
MGMVPIFLIGSGICSAASVDSIEAYVNDEPITSRELKLQIALNRSQILSYFRDRFGSEVTSEKKFWTTRYGTEIPTKRLRDLAMAKLKRIKVQEILARQKSIVSHISYDTFLANLDKDNKWRDSMIACHGVVYGLTHYTEQTFYDYELSSMVTALQKKLASKELKPSLVQLHDYYGLIRDQYFKASDSIVAQITEVSYTDSTSRNELLQDSAWKINGHQIYRIFSESTSRFDHFHDGQRLSVAETLSVGSVSGIIDDGSSLSILKVISRKINGFKSFEQVEPIVSDKYMEFTYEAYIDSLMRTVRFCDLADSSSANCASHPSRPSVPMHF